MTVPRDFIWVRNDANKTSAIIKARQCQVDETNGSLIDRFRKLDNYMLLKLLIQAAAA